MLKGLLWFILCGISTSFSMLMADKKNALQVYNALNGTHYDDPELVEIHTIDKGGDIKSDRT